MRLLVLLAFALLLAGCTAKNEHVDTLSAATPSAAPEPAPTPTPSPSPSPTAAPTPSPSPSAAPSPTPSPSPAPKAQPHTRVVEGDFTASVIVGVPGAPTQPPACPDPAPCNGTSFQPDAAGAVLKVEEGNVSSALLKANWSSAAPAPTDATMTVQVKIGDKVIAQAKGSSPLVVHVPAAALAQPTSLTVMLVAEPGSAGVKEGAHAVLTLAYA